MRIIRIYNAGRVGRCRCFKG